MWQLWFTVCCCAFAPIAARRRVPHIAPRHNTQKHLCSLRSVMCGTRRCVEKRCTHTHIHSPERAHSLYTRVRAPRITNSICALARRIRHQNHREPNFRNLFGAIACGMRERSVVVACCVCVRVRLAMIPLLGVPAWFLRRCDDATHAAHSRYIEVSLCTCVPVRMPRWWRVWCVRRVCAIVLHFLAHGLWSIPARMLLLLLMLLARWCAHQQHKTHHCIETIRFHWIEVNCGCDDAQHFGLFQTGGGGGRCARDACAPAFACVFTYASSARVRSPQPTAAQHTYKCAVCERSAPRLF